MLLVIVHQRPVHFRLANALLEYADTGDHEHSRHEHRHDQLETQAREIDHEEAGREHEHGGAEVRLLGDDRDRQDQDDEADDVIPPPDAALSPLEIPGEHERHRNLHDLRGLDHHAYVTPPFRAFA